MQQVVLVWVSAAVVAATARQRQLSNFDIIQEKTPVAKAFCSVNAGERQ